MEKVVFIDLDGTFLSEDKKILPENKVLLDKLYENKISVVPATGRPLKGIPLELLEHPSVKYALCSNGSVIYEVKEKKLLKSFSLSKELLTDLYQRLSHFDIQFDVFADDLIYSEKARLDRLDEFNLEPHMRAYVLDVRTPIEDSLIDYIKNLKRIDRTNFFFKKIQDKEEIYKIVGEYPSLYCSSSLPTNIEVMHVDANKGKALKWLMHYLNLSLLDSIAFGDSNNDYAMLEIAGDGVAMGNADDECKRLANHITLSNDEAGVAVYLNELINI